jgi:hypothetical protein
VIGCLLVMGISYGLQTVFDLSGKKQENPPAE